MPNSVTTPAFCKSVTRSPLKNCTLRNFSPASFV